MFMATNDDIERAKKIILDTINKKIIVDNKELIELAEKVLDISYSIGGGYDESTIRQIAQVKIKEWFNI